MRVRRALLFMPGDDRRKIEKGAALGADSVIMDLEDGVAFSQKAAAREITRAALSEVKFGRTERLVRINPADSDLYIDDLNATIDGQPDGYVLPKAETAEDVRAVDSWLRHVEYERDWQVGSIALLAIIETALGVVNLREIADASRASPRLQALIFGAEDLAGDIGAVRTPDGWEGFYARSAVVLHAKAFGLQAIDTPFVHLGEGDADQLHAETEQARYMGYDGKLAIHPKQVESIQRIFTPSDEEITRARTLIAAYEAHQSKGTGVFQLGGKMIDMPMTRAAQAVIAKARAAGMIKDE